MNTQHTPGPWQVLNTPVLAATDNLMVRRLNSPYNLLTMHLGTNPEQWAEQEANARLIAEAPALLAALEEAVEHCDNFVIWLDKARDAIAKAELPA